MKREAVYTSLLQVSGSSSRYDQNLRRDHRPCAKAERVCGCSHMSFTGDFGHNLDMCVCVSKKEPVLGSSSASDKNKRFS